MHRSPHGMADEAAAPATRNGAVVRVYVGHHIVSDVVLKVTGGGRAGIHRSVINGLRIRKNDNHLMRPLRECAFYGLRDVNLVRPLFGANGVTVQRVGSEEHTSELQSRQY